MSDAPHGGPPPQGRLPEPASRPRLLEALPGACDSHVHVFAGPEEFARDPNRTEDPAPGDLATWCERLDARLAILGLSRVVLIHSVVYRENNAATVAALGRMGRHRTRGVALLRPEIADGELDHLHEAGMRGVRLDLVFPGALRPEGAVALAPRLAERGWHVQIFGKLAEGHADVIADLAGRLPAPTVLDHLAYPVLREGPDGAGFRMILSLMERGRTWVKLSSLYRQADPPYEALEPFLRALFAANPERVIWGSNWPHVRWEGPPPDDGAVLDALTEMAGEDVMRRILVDNPQQLYDFDPHDDHDPTEAPP